MLFSSVALLSSCEGGDQGSSGKLAYTVNEDNATCTITGLGEYGLKDVVIPEAIDGYKVTSIGSKAFFDCSTLTSITIGSNIKSIGVDAFYGCSGLTSVHISDLEAWLNISFEDYWSNPCFPGGQLYINGEPITTITIPDGTTSIGPFTFAGHSHLTSITIPDSVTSIGNHAFYNCDSLTSVAIGNGVTSIERGAFFGCSGLTNINLPNSLTVIGPKAFNGCSALTSITIPGKVESIGSMAFMRCTKLTSIRYTGTVSLWNQIDKSQGWCQSCPVTEVACTNGTVGVK